MVDVYAGQKIRAADMTDVLGVIGMASSDITVNASTTLVDATGVDVALDADSLYILDGYISYVSGATPDIKFAWTIPAGMTGHWAMYMQTSSATASVGSIDARHATSFTTALAAAGSGSFSSRMACLPRAYLDTAGTAGTLQLQFAQNTSDASDTIVKAGSWIRALKVG